MGWTHVVGVGCEVLVRVLVRMLMVVLVELVHGSDCSTKLSWAPWSRQEPGTHLLSNKIMFCKERDIRDDRI